MTQDRDRSGFPAGFSRDVNAVMSASGYMLPTEVRDNLRMAGMDLKDDDSLEVPEFELPTVDDEEVMR